MAEKYRIDTIGKLLNQCGSGRALLSVDDRLVVRHVAEVLPSLAVIEQLTTCERGKNGNLIFGVKKFLKQIFISHLADLA
ncbi:MAG: hypothetical protein LAO30_22350 [Acidobacteriia bacterium]|nr:hypothetical protein [Terriglobia bacterium]